MNSRRRFLRNSSLMMTLPLLDVQAASYVGTANTSKEPYRTIAIVYDDMFPATSTAPGAKQLNSIGYLHGVMRDKRVGEETKVFITNGAIWLDEESVTMFKKAYRLLSTAERQKVLDAIMGQNWGDSWLYTVMSYLFESMFSDPVYGANTDMSGWRWLEYEPGFPRPKKVVS